MWRGNIYRMMGKIVITNRRWVRISHRHRPKQSALEPKQLNRQKLTEMAEI